MNILIAEDDDLLRKSLAYFLRNQGYTVWEHTNGEEALAMVREKTPDVIVTDLNMPFLGGMEMIYSVRNELKLNIPIIVLTASGLETIELQAFDIGASEFMAKPFSPSVLKARIDRLVKV